MLLIEKEEDLKRFMLERAKDFDASGIWEADGTYGANRAHGTNGVHGADGTHGANRAHGVGRARGTRTHGTGRASRADGADTHAIQQFLQKMGPSQLKRALHDMGGHDLSAVVQALQESKKDLQTPTFLIAHTIKGWGLKCMAQSSNHSSLPEKEEVDALKKKEGLSKGMLFERFALNSPEGAFLKQRRETLLAQKKEHLEIAHENRKKALKDLPTERDFPTSLNINLKMVTFPHTQWMLGQLVSKLNRIANASKAIPTPAPTSAPTPTANTAGPLKDERERVWAKVASFMVSMSPDVGTSTNLNPNMDGKIFSQAHTHAYEEELPIRDKRAPYLVPGQERSHRFLRFEIAESNAMTCTGAFGKMFSFLGIPFLPLMTVYDFFIKRALDQYFYNMYWQSSFILAGTPSGITLSPEGAQHGWKSDLQVPHQTTWEPFFCLELDWIFCDTVKRHFLTQNKDRSGVVIRCVTRGVDQKLLLKCLKRQKRFKQEIPFPPLSEGGGLCPNEFPLKGAIKEGEVPSLPESQILACVRREVLSGAYCLVDYRGYADYQPGDNVVHLFSMGSVSTEALVASEALLKKGIYANVLVVTNPDLLLGAWAHQNNYAYLKESLGINNQLYLSSSSPSFRGGVRRDRDMERAVERAEVLQVAGRRIPIVSVHDGEPGLLDNIGSIVGVRQVCCAVRKHSRSGRPKDIYKYHGLDRETLVKVTEKLLDETAEEGLQVSPQVLESLNFSNSNSSSNSTPSFSSNSTLNSNPNSNSSFKSSPASNSNSRSSAHPNVRSRSHSHSNVHSHPHSETSLPSSGVKTSVVSSSSGGKVS